jgi:outer membrane protein OmpA-like peptidoglycan-associated protein
MITTGPSAPATAPPGVRSERTRRARRAAGAALAVTTLVCACGVRPAPPVQPPSDLVVLVADPEDGTLGRAVVRAQGAMVELALEGAATRVFAGQPPGAPAPLAAADIQRIFGEALGARPLPPRHFLLYFQIGSDDLTAESQAELPQIVAFVRNRPVPDVSVIGHTDTTGTPASNTDLGLQRATLIGAQLVTAGIPANQIEITSHGEANLLVATPDNVAEARNRRVEVTVR